MALKPATYVCDGCGVTKGQTNHWWSVVIGETALISPFGASMSGAPVDEWGNATHYCGQGCALKAVSLWMDKQGVV